MLRLPIFPPRFPDEFGYPSVGGGGAISAPWYLAGGVDPSSLIAAYQPNLATSLAASYLRVAGSGGNSDLDPAVVGGVAPTWDIRGWKGNGANMYLITGVIPTPNMSIIAEYWDAVSGANFMLGGDDLANVRVDILPNNSNKISYYNGALLAVAPGLASGRIGISGNKGVRNGVFEPGTIGAWGAGTAYEFYLLCTNAKDSPSNYSGVYLSKVAFYNTSLSEVQFLSITNAMKQPVAGRMVAFGDSITAGSAATGGIENRWANIVADTKGWSLQNSGVAGTILQNTVQNTVATIGGAVNTNGRDSFSSRVAAYLPSYACLLYGINDILLDDVAITVANFETDLGEVVDGLITNGISASNIIIGSPPYITTAGYTATPPWDGGSGAEHATYVTACASVASAKGCTYIDVYQWMADNGGDSLISGDGVHPNNAGHAAIAAAFLSVL